MIPVSQSEFEELIRGARLLEQDRHGPKVYETPDGRVVKLFRVKRQVSSNLVCPYAVRFARNASNLATAGVPSVRVERVAKVPHLQRQMVIYSRLPGLSLRHALRNATPLDAGEMIRKVGSFISNIHEKGVFFRSMHFGNLLVEGNGDAFSLIDILDLRVRRGPLGFRRRQRNFRHLIHYDEDRARLVEHWGAFRGGYEEWTRENASRSAPMLGPLIEGYERQLRSGGLVPPV